MSDERQHANDTLPSPEPRKRRAVPRGERKPERYPPVRRDDSVEHPGDRDPRPGSGSDA